MTYQELVSKLKDTYQEKDASKISEHLAIQFNIQGEAEGALYLEIANGQYLLTTLYNAPTTIDNYYAAMVSHDLAVQT